MIGNQATEGQLNNNLASIAITLRTACQQARDFNTYITQQQTQASLEALGFTATDAASFLTAVSYLNTVAEVYFGTQGQAPAGQTAADFDFDNALSAAWGGQ